MSPSLMVERHRNEKHVSADLNPGPCLAGCRPGAGIHGRSGIGAGEIPWLDDRNERSGTDSGNRVCLADGWKENRASGLGNAATHH